MEWHQVNLITGSACDFIFPEDPISVLKFREIGYKSFFVPIECNEDIFKDYGQEKDIDVLIFGRLKTDREFYIDKLRKSEINFKFVTPYLPESDSMLKLAKLINRSKITLALTKSANGTKYFNPLKNFKNFYQLKGRVFMTGLCKSLCISEYCPSYDLIYRNETIPVFKNKDEFLPLIKTYLENEKLLEEKTEAFYKETQRYADKNYINEINMFINSCPKMKHQKPKFPLWYHYLFTNQFLRFRLKNNKFTSFYKQFIEIITDFKEDNFLDNCIKKLFIMILFLRYFPLLIVKMISKIFK